MTNIASECRSANIARDHATILSDDATPKPDGIFGKDKGRRFPQRCKYAAIGSAPQRRATIMQNEEPIAITQRYKDELEGILSRFKKTRDSIYIDQRDDSRFRELVLELRDFFDDAFVEGRRHSQPLLAYFNDSISNYVGSPSYSGVENVKGVVASALVRLQRNPLGLKKAALEAKAPDANDPDLLVT